MFRPDGRIRPRARAIGSAGERLVHTEEVTGSIPVSPTQFLQFSPARQSLDGFSQRLWRRYRHLSTLAQRHEYTGNQDFIVLSGVRPEVAPWSYDRQGESRGLERDGIRSA